MLERIAAIALNTYRENVRARLLHGLFALAIATAGYSLIVGAYAFRDTVRVISDVGAASASLYGIVVAIVLGASSLYRELELKTAFPILARPIARWEYLVGKFVGAWLTLVVFVALDTAVLLLSVAAVGGGPLAQIVGTSVSMLVLLVWASWRRLQLSIYAPVVLAIGWLMLGWWFSAVVPDERRVLVGSAILALGEIAIVIAVANVFAAFSSPFLTAMLTLGIVVVGRSADTLARLPPRLFGSSLSALGKGLASVVPNTMLYVPPRALMTGEVPGANFPLYVLKAMAMSVGWVVLLLILSSLLFRRRDFT